MNEDKDLVARQKLLGKTIKRIVSSLKEKYKPQKIILFGSCISANLTFTSDIDLLIVKKTNKNFYDRLREVVTLCDYEVGVDFLVYTPEEFREEAKNNLFFQKEILEKGKVIYDAAA
ncbi:MAG: nucleotidyltransferase domain-containing protein [Actinobacteria bacterium]|nr:nucleotidyltransferase domain-containing protein [Actinomycetota bacterium]